MVNPLDRLAEEKLAAAIAAGEFADLPGQGEPLELEDLSQVDEELRAGYLLLKGANALPEEMALKKELLTLGDLVRACEDGTQRKALEERRRGLALRYEILMERRRRS
jgi:hypothetical protein